jgi:hypothetical protein
MYWMSAYGTDCLFDSVLVGVFVQVIIDLASSDPLLALVNKCFLEQLDVLHQRIIQAKRPHNSGAVFILQIIGRK